MKQGKIEIFGAKAQRAGIWSASQANKPFQVSAAIMRKGNAVKDIYLCAGNLYYKFSF